MTRWRWILLLISLLVGALALPVAAYADLLVVVGEGKDPATLDRFADMLGERLDARKSHVRKVEWKMDPAYFSRTAFYHASIAELESVAKGLEENASLLEEVRRVDGVVALDRAVASALRRAAKAPAPAGEDTGAGPLVGLLEKERDFLRDPEGFVRGYETATSSISWRPLPDRAGRGSRGAATSGDRTASRAPLMGVLAAAIFAGQMLNFTVAGGTSGHLMGATLATILLGPWAAIIGMTTVVGIQALIFQDGGLLALGANIFNMAVIGVTFSYFSYTSFKKLFGENRVVLYVNSFVTAWLSIFIASLAVALQVAASGTSPANVSVPAMGGIHAIIGIGEGLITVGALAFIYVARRDLVQASQPAPAGKVIWVVGLGIALLLAVFSPLASAHPDGLEWVAKQKGFLDGSRFDTAGMLLKDFESLEVAIASLVFIESTEHVREKEAGTWGGPDLCRFTSAGSSHPLACPV